MAFEDCEKFLDDCEFYACVESHKKCGKKGYLEGFGLRYCEKFEKKKHNFSDNGKLWMNEVKLCLISELEKIDDNNSCSSFKKESIKNHVPCYINSGYCELSKKDKLVVINTIKYSLYRPSLIKAGLAVLKNCK